MGKMRPMKSGGGGPKIKIPARPARPVTISRPAMTPRPAIRPQIERAAPAVWAAVPLQYRHSAAPARIEQLRVRCGGKGSKNKPASSKRHHVLVCARHHLRRRSCPARP